MQSGYDKGTGTAEQAVNFANLALSALCTGAPPCVPSHLRACIVKNKKTLPVCKKHVEQRK